MTLLQTITNLEAFPVFLLLIGFVIGVCTGAAAFGISRKSESSTHHMFIKDDQEI